MYTRSNKKEIRLTITASVQYYKKTPWLYNYELRRTCTRIPETHSRMIWVMDGQEICVSVCCTNRLCESVESLGKQSKVEDFLVR